MDEPIKLFSKMSERYPEPDDEDRLHARTRAAIAAIPGVGGSITELMNIVLVPPVARRRDEWFRELADVVEEIGRRKAEPFDPATLSENEAFVTAVIRTSRIALGTHREEKRRMLRNALVKIGTGESRDEDMQEIWFRIIEDLSPSHIKLLHFLAHVGQRMLKEQGQMPIGVAYGWMLEHYHPQLADNIELLDQVLQDLGQFRLVVSISTWDYIKKLAFPQQIVSSTGMNFLRFVLTPEDLLK